MKAIFLGLMVLCAFSAQAANRARTPAGILGCFNKHETANIYFYSDNTIVAIVWDLEKSVASYSAITEEQLSNQRSQLFDITKNVSNIAKYGTNNDATPRYSKIISGHFHAQWMSDPSGGVGDLPTFDRIKVTKSVVGLSNWIPENPTFAFAVKLKRALRHSLDDDDLLQDFFPIRFSQCVELSEVTL